MVDCQKPQARLSEKTFGSIQDLREIRNSHGDGLPAKSLR